MIWRIVGVTVRRGGRKSFLKELSHSNLSHRGNDLDSNPWQVTWCIVGVKVFVVVKNGTHLNVCFGNSDSLATGWERFHLREICFRVEKKPSPTSPQIRICTI